MKSITEAHFLEWAAAKGLHLDPQYPRSAILRFSGARQDARFWEVPAEAPCRPHFIETLLRLLGDWQLCYAWRHLGSWPQHVDPRRINDAVERNILRGLGLPLGTADVVEFTRDEIDKLVTLMFSTTVFGWSVGDDLYVIPDHAQALLQTDHHGVIHVVCRDPADVRRWIDGMKQADYDLPEDLPDETFKRPPWMAGEDG